MAPQTASSIEVFYSYSHRDEELRDQLENHLAILRRKGFIKAWHDRRICAGREWEGLIDDHLNSADIILLLVSSDFLASDYCYDVEVKQAMEKHEARKCRVIPIILRPCDWQRAPFGKLQALPKHAKPITLWANRDEALLSVVEGIRDAVRETTECFEAATASEDGLELSSETKKAEANLWAIVLSGTISDSDRARVEAIVEHLRQVSGDIHLTLRRIVSGSIKLYFQGTREGFERVEAMFKSGMLNEVLNYKVQDVRRISAEALRELAREAETQSDLEEAQRLYNESLKVEIELDNPRGIISTLRALAELARKRGNTAEAENLDYQAGMFETNLIERTRLLDKLEDLQRQLGEAEDSQSLLHRAQETRHLYERVLESNIKLGDRARTAKCLIRLGNISYQEMLLTEARRFYSESLKIQQEIGDQSDLAGTLYNLGLVAQRQGDETEAQRLYNESLALATKLGDERTLKALMLRVG